jgi:hypothetical protein
MATIGGGEVEHHLHGRGLSRTVGAEKPGDPTRLDSEAEVIDDGVVAVPLREVVNDEGVVLDGSGCC